MSFVRMSVVMSVWRGKENREGHHLQCSQVAWKGYSCRAISRAAQTPDARGCRGFAEMVQVLSDESDVTDDVHVEGHVIGDTIDQPDPKGPCRNKSRCLTLTVKVERAIIKDTSRQ